MVVFKLIPMVLMTAGVVCNADKLQLIIDHVKTIAIQAELNEITQVILLDKIGGDKLPTQDDLAEYLKANMKINSQSGAGRDVSADQFGTPYRIEYPEGSVKVTSAGIDKAFDTGDDIYSMRSLN